MSHIYILCEAHRVGGSDVASLFLSEPHCGRWKKPRKFIVYEKRKVKEATPRRVEMPFELQRMDGGIFDENRL